MQSIEERFWKYVKKTDSCWLWTGGCRVGRYGGLGRGPRGTGVVSAHRLSYEINVGPIPTGAVIMHTCDNPLCVNPEHLRVGTQRDNMLDMVAKGRIGKTGPKPGTGAKNKLTLREAEIVREKYGAGVSQQKLAAEYGIGQATVSRIIRRLVLTR